jgi:hypothetical protein
MISGAPKYAITATPSLVTVKMKAGFQNQRAALVLTQMFI